MMKDHQDREMLNFNSSKKGKKLDTGGSDIEGKPKYFEWLFDLKNGYALAT